ncbi:MAG: META domain-containing protein [Spirochaetaceae bacterium]|jgi:heat shock protein HslJ|nr:META domain-containing protein [Spirochaetaceae bacterium]
MKFVASIFMILCAFSGCATGGAAFDGVDWQLVEVKTSKTPAVILDRDLLTANGMGDFFSLRFETTGLFGKAAPNRYFGDCTWEATGGLSLGNIGSTKMLAFREPDGLNENGYFEYLNQMNHWALKNGRLELSGGTGNDRIVMIFRKR